MANLVDILEIRDGISAPMAAATAAMEKAADAADKLAETTERTATRAGRSATSYVNQYDAATKLARAERELAAATETMNTAVATGFKSQEQANAVLDGLAAKVGAARAAVLGQDEAQGKAAVSAGNQAFATRQLAVQLSQTASSIASGMPVYMTLIQQGHQLADVAMSTGTGFRGMATAAGSLFNAIGGLPTLIGVGVVGSLAALVINAESATGRINTLQQTLRATRDDFAAMASEAEHAANAFAATSSFSTSDSRAAANAIASAPNFAGTQAQMQTLLAVAGDLATMFGDTLPAEAQKLAAAMVEPGAMAQKLADAHFRGLNQTLVDSIKVMAEGGDKAGAFGKLIDAVRETSDGAAHSVKTKLGAALEDLSAAFTMTGRDGKTFGENINGAVDSIAAGAVRQITDLVAVIRDAFDRIDQFAKDHPLLAKAAGFGADVAARALIPGYGLVAGSATSGLTAVSPAGALGTMQLMPGTAAQMGVNPFSQAGNIEGGMKYIDYLAHMQDKAGNARFPSEYAIAGAYNSGPNNYSPLGATGYNKLVAGANVASLPSDVASQIDYWGNVLGLPPNLVALGKRIAMVENKGQQGPLPGQPGVYGPPEPYGPPASMAGTGNYGATNDPQQTVSDALKAARSAGASGYTSADAAAQIDKYTAALAELRKEGKAGSADFGILTEALQKAQLAYADALSPLGKLSDATRRQIGYANELADAQEKGFGAVVEVTARTKAEAEARSIAAPGTAAYSTAVRALTAEYVKLAAAQQSVQAGGMLSEQKQAIEYLQAERSLVGENADVRAIELARVREIQLIDKTLPDIDADRRDKLIANAEAIARGTQELQHQQQALQELGNMATQIADQLGNALTQAFVQGSGGAVNFGNVAKGILASILQQVGKLAVINPIMNSLTGSTATTLADVGGILGAGGSGGGGGMLSSLGSLGSLGNASGLFSGGGALSGLLSTPLWSSGASFTAGESALMAQMGITSPGSITLGGFAGGAGLGFGAGMLTNSLLGGNQTSGMIGSAGGALAGAAIGSIIPGVGTVVGGLVGGVIGGGGGGMIGPGKKNTYSSTGIGLSNGQLTLGGTNAQGMDASGERTAAQQQVDQINAFLASSGLRLTSKGDLGQVGQNSPGGYQDPTKFGSVGAAFGGFRFSSGDSQVDKVVAGKSFSDLNALASAVNVVTGFMNQTLPALRAWGQVNGTLNESVSALHTTFDSAINTARDLGVGESELTDIRDKAVKKLYDDAGKVYTALEASYTGRYMSAAASISGNPADAKAAALFSFDQQAQQQRDALSEQMVATFGDAFKTGTDYAREMANLERTLGEERLAIAQSYADRLTSTATATVTSLSDYVMKLELGSNSPLSPQDQYTAALDKFNAVSSAATSGDWNSTQQLSGYADSLLSASRTMNGSGAGYVADFNRVLDVLANIAGQAPDTLTASIYQNETRSQTQILSDDLQTLRAEIVTLRQTLTQASSAPARVAA